MSDQRYVIIARESGQFLVEYPSDRDPAAPWVFSPEHDLALALAEHDADHIARDLAPIACDVIAVPA